MKYILNVSDADGFFEKVKRDKMFSWEKSTSGLNLKYNGVFTVISNPKITLIKNSDTEIEINIRSGLLVPIIATAFTLFFWAMGIIAAVTQKLSVPVIVIVFLLPMILWMLHFLFNKVIGKQIIEHLKYIS